VFRADRASNWLADEERLVKDCSWATGSVGDNRIGDEMADDFPTMLTNDLLRLEFQISRIEPAGQSTRPPSRHAAFRAFSESLGIKCDYSERSGHGAKRSVKPAKWCLLLISIQNVVVNVI
jgi:hypothetical protein